MEDALTFAVVAATIVGSISSLFFSVAWIRRRFGSEGVAGPTELRQLRDQIARLETAMDTVAVEVERISEGQRFTTKLLADRAGASSPREAAQSER